MARYSGDLRMPPFFKSVSGMALVALIALLALQAFPYTGIFLMMLGGALLTGLLIQVFLISLLAEACLGRIPRVLAALPVLAYAGYYALYIHQTIQIGQESARLQRENSAKVFDFDPDTYSLVTPDAQRLAEQYAIPVVYQANKNYAPESHLSFRLLQRDQCSRIPLDSRHRIAKFGVNGGNSFQNNLCLLRFPEDPSGKLITVVKHGDEEVWKRKWDFGEQSTEVLVDGKVVGTFKTASIWRLPLWPAAAVGCGLISGGTPAWKCFADFQRTHTEIDTIPPDVDHAKYGLPESVMLGIPRYTSVELANFQGSSRNSDALTRVAEEPRRVEDDSFALLQQIVDGQNPTTPVGLGYSLALDPARLTPFAEPMAKRLAELVKGYHGNTQERYQIEALDTALASLPLQAFAPVSDSIFEFVRHNEGWKRYPRLYVRAAESGTKTLAYYQSQFMSGEIRGYKRQLPVLAICRIGQADPDIVTEMKQRFIASSADENYQAALLVTLLKVGEEAFVKANMPVSARGNYQSWAEAVTSGSGKTAIGPNNCMGKEWGEANYVSAVMAPALRWNRGGWSVRGQT
jgi:hypothetical protein